MLFYLKDNTDEDLVAKTFENRLFLGFYMQIQVKTIFNFARQHMSLAKCE
jgi:hypothetical protein